jgi:hypothetical protein
VINPRGMLQVLDQRRAPVGSNKSFAFPDEK